MTGALSPSHWLIILAVVLLLFGAKRLPDAARGVGKSLRIFKAETAALRKDDESPAAVSPAQPETGSGTPAPTSVDPTASTTRTTHTTAA